MIIFMGYSIFVLGYIAVKTMKGNQIISMGVKTE